MTVTAMFTHTHMLTGVFCSVMLTDASVWTGCEAELHQFVLSSDRTKVTKVSYVCTACVRVRVTVKSVVVEAVEAERYQNIVTFLLNPEQ